MALLRIHFSNRIEKLADALVDELQAAPLADPLTPETIVIGHAGMDEWLKRELARRLGIAANLDFQQPGTFIWRMLRAREPDLPKSSPLDRGPLVWRLYAALASGDQAPEVRHYLERGDALSRFELAETLAARFEQYQIYRPDWILAWEVGRSAVAGDDWQAALWRDVADRATPNPARLYQAFMNHAGELSPDVLPARISVFGISALAPVYLELLAALAATRTVDCYVPNPSRAYWGDIESEARLARWQLSRPERAEYATSGQPLLAALGTQSRDFIELLHGLNDELVTTAEHFVRPGAENLLARLQTDVLELAQPESVPRGGDDSLIVHVCHSRRREVEVLHDALLAAFENDPSLGPEDILVMAPNMDDYADHIRAVFAAAPPGRHIPWSLAERSARSGHPLVEAFLTLLDLPDSRLKASEVLGLLDLPAIARARGLDSGGLDAIHHWTSAVGVRWAWDGAHRGELDLPPDEVFSWRFGLDRLLAGYALAPEDDSPWQDIAPWGDLEGQGARALGPLCEFAARLDGWRETLAESRPLDDWVATLQAMLNHFAPETPDEESAMAMLRRTVGELGPQARLAAFEGPVPRSVVRAALAARLAMPRHPRPFLSGRVTFCALAPMRSIPAKLVWLLGMSETDFPRRGRAPGFDLIAGHPRRGDRARHSEDRALFLEALLSARDAFHASYVGLSERDNAPLPASVVINLLLDVAERMGATHDDLVLEHPLQPFSASYRARPASPCKASYAREWLQPARADLAPGAFGAPLPPAAADGDGREVVDLQDLIRGLSNPARRYLDRLGVAHAATHADEEDDEPFVLDGLEKWRLKEALLDQWLAVGKDFGPEPLYPVFAARGWLPPGEVGRLTFRAARAEVEQVACAVFARTAGVARPHELDLALDSCRLVGRVDDLYTQGGLVRARAGRLRPADRLTLWVTHLALAVDGLEVPGHFLASEKGELETVRLDPTTPAEARSALEGLCKLYARSALEPLAFLPELSFKLCKPGKKGELPETSRALAGVRTAWRNWEAGREHAFIAGAEDYAVVFRGCEELFGEAFVELARSVFAPIVAAEVAA